MNILSMIFQGKGQCYNMYHRYARQEEPGGPELEEMVAGELLPDVAAGAEIKQMMELTEVAATHRQRDKGSRVVELYRQIQVLNIETI